MTTRDYFVQSVGLNPNNSMLGQITPDIIKKFLFTLPANSTFTNFDVKNALRSYGFKVSQQDVKDVVDSLIQSGEISVYSDNGMYRTFTFVTQNSSVQNDDEDVDEDDFEDTDEDEDDDEDEDQNSGLQVKTSKPKRKKIPTPNIPVTLDARTGTWCVSSELVLNSRKKPKFLYVDANFNGVAVTRDQARCIYCRFFGVPIQKVKASLVK